MDKPKDEQEIVSIPLQDINRFLDTLSLGIGRLASNPTPESEQSLRLAVTDFRKTIKDLTAKTSAETEPVQKQFAQSANIIVRRSLSELLDRGELKPGQYLPGTQLTLINVWKPVNPDGEKLSFPIASFAAPEELPGMFHQSSTIRHLADLSDRHGYNGWKYKIVDLQDRDPRSYERFRFKGYRDGSAFSLWAIPELPLVNGQDRDGNLVSPEANMLVFNKDRSSPFHGSLNQERRSDRTQTCTDDPKSIFSVFYVNIHKETSYTTAFGISDRVPVRPIIAQPLHHLVK